MRKIWIITCIICIIIFFYTGFRSMSYMLHGQIPDPIFFWVFMITGSLIALSHINFLNLIKNTTVVGGFGYFLAVTWIIILLILIYINSNGSQSTIGLVITLFMTGFYLGSVISSKTNTSQERPKKGEVRKR